MDKVNFNGATGNIDQLRSHNKVENDRANEHSDKTKISPLTLNDEISVSDRATSIHQMVEKISNIPQVRQERIESLREQIDSGNYNPSSKDIADAILREDN